MAAFDLPADFTKTPRLQDGAPFRHGFCIARHLWLLAESLLHCEGWCHGDSFAVNMTSDCQGLLRTTSNQSSNSYFWGWVDDKSPNNHQLLPSLTAKVRWQCDPTNWTFVREKTLIWPWFCEIIRWDPPFFTYQYTISTKVRLLFPNLAFSPWLGDPRAIWPQHPQAIHRPGLRDVSHSEVQVDCGPGKCCFFLLLPLVVSLFVFQM